MKKNLLFLFALVTMATHAQTPGDIAQSFGEFPGFIGNVRTIELQTDGKILVGGDFSSYKGATENKIIRLNSDGSKDTAFSTGTGFNDNVHAIAIQADGKILVGGSFSTYNAVTENKIIRLNNDGTKDATFDTGTGFQGSVYSIKLQSDGKILVGGFFTSYNGLTENRIIRLNSDGTKDTSFNAGTGFNDRVLTIEQQIDGKILVGGMFTSYNGTSEGYIIRLNNDGSKDATFDTGSGFDFDVFIIKQLADGKILVGGDFSEYDASSANKIIRLNADGSKDFTFNTGTGFNRTVWSIEEQAGGQILVGGEFTTYKDTSENKIIRLNADGSKDVTFTAGVGFYSTIYTTIYTIAQQVDGKILVGGSFYTFNAFTEYKMIRLNSDGSKDTTFNTGNGTGFNGYVYEIAQQTDGKTLIGGNFSSYNGVTENSIIRLNSDGSKDTTFTTGTGFRTTGFSIINGNVYSIALQTDGKILVGGHYNDYNGVTEGSIIRLNSDGTKDATFNTGTGFDGAVKTIVIQADGKILVGGEFANYNGALENFIIRLNSDGTKDTTFNSGTGFDAIVNVIVQQADGKILAGGGFTFYNNGFTPKGIIRLNGDGTKDTSFNTGTGFDKAVWTIAQQTDGKLLIGGDFSQYNDINERNIIRLNSDGTKDTSFATGTGFDGSVYTIAKQADGKILVGGFFNSYNGSVENMIILLNNNGTKDTNFNTGAGFNNTVYTIEQQADGKILVGGWYTNYKEDNSSAFLIKLHTETSLSTTSFDTEKPFVIYPNPAQEVLHLQTNNFTSIKAIKIYDLQGKVVLQDTNETINISNLSKGLYIIKITNENGEVSKKFIKE
jgi:uncharacterized delta-60 repeat protein